MDDRIDGAFDERMTIEARSLDGWPQGSPSRAPNVGLPNELVDNIAMIDYTTITELNWFII